MILYSCTLEKSEDFTVKHSHLIGGKTAFMHQQLLLNCGYN